MMVATDHDHSRHRIEEYWDAIVDSEAMIALPIGCARRASWGVCQEREDK